MKKFTPYFNYFALIISIISIFGSLYYSEVRHFIPCSLCWYQRILMFPLAIILGVGISRQDREMYKYALPFSVLGVGVSFFHVLLQNGIIPEKIGPCVIGASCTIKYAGFFGLSIPVLAFLSFTLISILVYLSRKNK